MKARSTTRLQVRATTAAAESDAEASQPAAPLLKFDFDGKPARTAAPRPARSNDGSIKDAIIRWLNEQL